MQLILPALLAFTASAAAQATRMTTIVKRDSAPVSTGLVTTALWQRPNLNQFDAEQGIAYFVDVDKLQATYVGQLTFTKQTTTSGSAVAMQTTMPYVIATGTVNAVPSPGAQPTQMPVANVQFSYGNALKGTDLTWEILCRLDASGNPVEALDGTECFIDGGQAACFLVDYDGKEIKTAAFNIQTGATKTITATPVAQATALANSEFLKKLAAVALGDL